VTGGTSGTLGFLYSSSSVPCAFLKLDVLETNTKFPRMHYDTGFGEILFLLT